MPVFDPASRPSPADAALLHGILHPAPSGATVSAGVAGLSAAAKTRPAGARPRRPRLARRRLRLGLDDDPAARPVSGRGRRGVSRDHGLDRRRAALIGRRELCVPRGGGDVRADRSGFFGTAAAAPRAARAGADQRDRDPRHRRGDPRLRRDGQDRPPRRQGRGNHDRRGPLEGRRAAQGRARRAPQAQGGAAAVRRRPARAQARRERRRAGGSGATARSARRASDQHRQARERQIGADRRRPPAIRPRRRRGAGEAQGLRFRRPARRSGRS